MTVKRRGMSLVNVMVFLLFVMMLTAQLFLFAKNAVDETADEREMMTYRMRLDSLVKEAENKLQESGGIVHIKTVSADYSDFYDKKEIRVWTHSEGTSSVDIYDLDYHYNYTGSFTPSLWKSNEKKVFAAIPHDTEPRQKTIPSGDVVTVEVPIRRYYLIRAWVQLPDKFYGTTLMYQKLVSRDNEDDDYAAHTVDTLSFQEVWF